MFALIKILIDPKRLMTMILDKIINKFIEQFIFFKI